MVREAAKEKKQTLEEKIVIFQTLGLREGELLVFKLCLGGGGK